MESCSTSAGISNVSSFTPLTIDVKNVGPIYACEMTTIIRARVILNSCGGYDLSWPALYHLVGGYVYCGLTLEKFIDLIHEDECTLGMFTSSTREANESEDSDEDSAYESTPVSPR